MRWGRHFHYGFGILHSWGAFTGRKEALSEELRKQLDQETAALLDKLEDVFVKRETASVEGAFREGVRVAILLALDLFPPSGSS